MGFTEFVNDVTNGAVTVLLSNTPQGLAAAYNVSCRLTAVRWLHHHKNNKYDDRSRHNDAAECIVGFILHDPPIMLLFGLSSLRSCSGPSDSELSYALRCAQDAVHILLLSIAILLLCIDPALG